MDGSEQIFQRDEMQLVAVESHWTAEEILAIEGIFFLKDIAKALNLEPVKVKIHAKDISVRGEDPWAVMGARKVWNHWMIRMAVFAPYYRKHLISHIRKVSAEWDGNTLLRQKGLFYLTDVCRLIPFTSHQLRYQAKRHEDARKQIGIWKDDELNAFVVDMAVFAPWIARLWSRNQGGED